MTYEKLNEMHDKKQIKYHHTSLFRGYVSRKNPPDPIPYKGRFGEGYKLERPNYNSTTYSFVTYYIFTDKEKENKE